MFWNKSEQENKPYDNNDQKKSDKIIKYTGL